MKTPPYHQHQRIDETISERTGVGPNALVSGWQNLLSGLMTQMAPFLKASQIVTFRHLTEAEADIFHSIIQKVDVPDGIWGLYLPHSVRNQMMYTNRGLSIPDEVETAVDDGVLLFSRVLSTETLINGLLARRPHTPAIDVYHQGGLLAGYVFKTKDECLDAMPPIIRDYLDRSP